MVSKSKPLVIRLEPAYRTALEQAAKRDGVTISDVARRALAERLRRGGFLPSARKGAARA